MFFFFQAEDGIRDTSVTGVQTCALPILQRVALDQRVYADQKTQEDQQRSRDPEEQHRLATEPQLEPDGAEVQYAHGNAADRELRLPCPPRLERDWTLGDPQALCPSSHHHDPLPRRAPRRAVH